MTTRPTPTGPRPAELSPIDAQARRIIGEQLDETLFVEASAGTGKTASLVGRVVNLVTTGRTTLDRIAAITFTEAAAAELRDRVRQGLEEASADESRSEEERSRCRQGITDLDQAAIRTLHAFAASLLHERPLEAGLPPAFETTDEVAAGIKFNEAWDTWLDAVLEEDSPLASHLALALTLGMTLPQLKDASLEFHRNYNDLTDVKFEAVAPAQTAAVGMLVDQMPEVERLCQFSRIGASDPLYGHVQSKLGAIRRLAEARPSSPTAYRLMLRILPLKYSRGRQGDWNVDPQTGDNACSALKNLLKELDDATSGEIAQARRAVLTPVLEGLREFALNYARQRRAEGRAEFHDLLAWAHELLRDNLEVRDHFRRRFSHLLIDEAQDTDPIQAEIAMFLAEYVPEGQPATSRPMAWELITPEKGKLFVVGDPKQSIYRFRRADVAQMKRLQQRMEGAGGRTVSLVQNFRSQKRLIAWVNRLFEAWMREDRNEGGGAGYFQVRYEAMSARWEGDIGDPFQPRVWALADTEVEDRIDAIRRQEAEDIGGLLRQIVDQQWQTLNLEATEATGREAYRPVKYSDICILMPSRTGLQILERGIEGQDIPYRLESASLIFETQEIRDLLNCLKAIDDPADQVATVAALRSPAFGCSDVELLRHYEDGGRFDYLQIPEEDRHGPVSEALDTLREFHRARVWDSTGALIDRFVRERELMEAAVGHPRMREQWRRYRFMVEQAWKFAAAGGSSLRAFVEWVEDQIIERARVTEALVPESDEEAVRVMTIHASKGLEFPVVILTGINSASSSRTSTALFDRGQGRVEVGLGPRDHRFVTAGYEELAERETLMSKAEHVRLMYVAATRARDHLVVSLRRSTSGRGAKAAAAAISEYLAGAPELWESVDLSCPPQPPETDSEDGGQDSAAPAEHSVEARAQWEERRKNLISEMGRPSFAAATALGRQKQEDKEERETPEPWRRGRAGTSVGRAVHAVLQSVDLATGDGIADSARAQAVAEGVPGQEGEIARLSRIAVESDVVKRAVASGCLWREVPVAVSTGGGSLHGFIDLLFEEDDGLVVVDYKTDSVGASETAESVLRYRLQGGAYAHALRQVTGKQVKEVVFLYLQPRREERLDGLAQAMQDAKEEAEALLDVAAE